MSSVDTAWLRMDRPSNLMMICGVLTFGERLTLARLKATLSDRFMRFKRFRQRAVQTSTGAYWKDDQHFDIGVHVRRVKLRASAGKAELETLVSKLMATPLDPSKPLWQFHLVEGYESGSAVVVRIHHCYADGIALIQVMLSMTDADREGRVPGPVPPPPKRSESTNGDPLARAFKMATKVGSVLIEKGVGLWHEPAKAVAFAKQGSAFTEELAKLISMDEDSRTCFKGQPGVAKRVAWADPIAVAEVKAVGRALDCSINDVLLSSVAGALRSYLLHEGESVEGLSIRALVPVNLRPAEEAWKLGNRFGLVFLDLPIGIENPVERLYAVRENMRMLKGSYQPVVALGVLAAMGAGPKILQEQLLAMLAKNATAVMTNVPGPQQPLYLGGALIASMMFWVPQSGDIGLGISILSYNGEVRFGVVADRGLCPDPDRVIERFAPEFDKLVLATLLSPWPWEQPPSAAQIEYAVSL
ncbi:MAG TPA: wax ester/triacylglycerol synthase family O-acyltransferase [Casimicrobiaceae bacterium]|jgi:diacylglycerol O-acyltransferase|nr:wax ester/triacylglycerol synthase family O-acyltransferase [Casimicrobiaceae bacterium]